MNRAITLSLLCALDLSACADSGNAVLLGSLERERIAVHAEASERILRIDVAEGDEVHAGDPILSLDTRRVDASLAQAEADARRAEAALEKSRNGSRSEAIEGARASVAGASARAVNARRERDRVAAIRQRGLIAQADLDRADTALRNAQAERDAARANLDELLNGTRIEDLEQAEADLARAQALVEQWRLNRARYEVRAPRDGRIDALPFRLGDQPAAGAVLVSVLAGPVYARVYVPASQRNRFGADAECRVHATGIEQAFTARLRSIRAEPAFTPYFALTGDDASRLSYRAELVLLDEQAGSLPIGLPVQAECNDRPAGP
jgi:HlyD family secretion protein